MPGVGVGVGCDTGSTSIRFAVTCCRPAKQQRASVWAWGSARCAGDGAHVRLPRARRRGYARHIDRRARLETQLKGTSSALEQQQQARREAHLEGASLALEQNQPVRSREAGAAAQEHCSCDDGCRDESHICCRTEQSGCVFGPPRHPLQDAALTRRQAGAAARAVQFGAAARPTARPVRRRVACVGARPTMRRCDGHWRSSRAARLRPSVGPLWAQPRSHGGGKFRRRGGGRAATPRPRSHESRAAKARRGDLLRALTPAAGRMQREASAHLPHVGFAAHFWIGA